MKINKLKTPYIVGDIPHNYHPTPNFKRDSFINLNGQWDFKVLNKDEVKFKGKITVPFAPESDLSGVNRITNKNDLLIYERKFYAEGNKRLLLHFGAVDNECCVFINGKKTGENIGGYLPFTIDITEYVTKGENTLTVYVTDTLNHTYPYGKQKHKRGGMWYTPISGIWQTVWLEYVPENYIKAIKIIPTLDSVTVKAEGGAENKTLIIENEEYSFTGNETTVKIENPKLWTPESPNIYNFTLISGEDKVESYFALRTVKIINNRICLNGKPYFFHGLLDQGYYPDGIFTPPSEKGFEIDILSMKDLGFNMLRKHIKLEPQIFYYLCDIHGMIVFQDFLNNGSYSFLYDTALPTIGLKRLPRTEPKKVQKIFYETAERTVDLLYNHPSVVYYTIFNEGWGQHNPKKAYNFFKKLDPNRIWDTASGWFKTRFTDVQSEHVYFKKADYKIKSDSPAVLSEFGGYSCNIEGHSFNSDKVYGYKICKTREDFTKDLEQLYLNEIILLIDKGLNATVLTQLSDIEDETNGILTYDRKIIKPNVFKMKEISEKLFEAFESNK